MRRALTILVVLGVAAISTHAQENRLEYSAVAISAGGPVSDPVAGQLQIVVERPSSEAERKKFLEALRKDQEAGLDVLKRLPPVGSVRAPGNLRWAMRYAHVVERQDGGRDIFLVTDRPMSFAESVEQPRTTRYPFTVIELHVNAKGEGEGSLHQAVRLLTLHREIDRIGLENYTVDPVKLTQVRQQH